MKKSLVILLLLFSGACIEAQEVLLPVRYEATPSKNGAPLSLPFFDDFSNPSLTRTQWETGGFFVNQGYAPLPPTIGMATLDAFDVEGYLYPTATGQLFTGDTLCSMAIRLDSVFLPYARPLTLDDSIYLSFFYLPGGGYGNLWERIGDVPESQDSLILEFYDPLADKWERAWDTRGISADTLFSWTGNYWQYCEILISNTQYLQKGFRFRFRNLCSLDNNNKNGILSNADQWNIDYVYLNAGRHFLDTAARDIAFVNPAPSMLKRYQAMPAHQFTPDEMVDNMPLTITNRYTEMLATEYGYSIYNDQGVCIHTYDGGYENAPVYWHGRQYQTAPAHANPPMGSVIVVRTDIPSRFTIVHGLKEGVSGDIHKSNDTISFTQIFDNYYAYDDGIPENGYGITSTTPKVRLACRFVLNTEDTLTALQLYFNRTYADQNSNIRFYITVWDDNNGHPGNIIYQDNERRKPLFEGFNRYVRYVLEEPLVCNGTIYVGFEQTTADYINLGFDRNNDASSQIFYLTGSEWQTSILRGALMLRPCFGQRATVAINSTEETPSNIFAEGNRITVETQNAAPVMIYNALGQLVFQSRLSAATQRITTPALPRGLYLVRIGEAAAKKIILYN